LRPIAFGLLAGGLWSATLLWGLSGIGFCGSLYAEAESAYGPVTAR
jgi:hypothetical protein